MDPLALSRGSRMDQHASGQMQPYIRPRSEDLAWSSGPDEICASSPNHDRGLRGPVPTQTASKSYLQKWGVKATLLDRLTLYRSIPRFLWHERFILPLRRIVAHQNALQRGGLA
jgi:hypothetical protein